jgi:hypothetical protein
MVGGGALAVVFILGRRPVTSLEYHGLLLLEVVDCGETSWWLKLRGL